MSSPCPLPNSKVSVVGVALSSHFEKPKGFSVGWLPLSNAYGITSLATQHKICHPFGVPLMDVCLAGVPCFALHRLPVFFHAFGIILFEMQMELI